MSDRIIVLHEGRVTADIPRDRATEERVMFAATGSADDADSPAGFGVGFDGGRGG
jgi:rhamnose transport system ATP-binding protein